MRTRWIEIAILLLLVCEMFLTHKLWLSNHNYPQIPFFSIFANLPVWLEWVGLAGIVIAVSSLVAKLLHHKQESNLRSAWFVLLISLAWLILFDQHRFQVWAWQIILYAFFLGGKDQSRTLSGMRFITISIYFYSAISKLDASFLNSYGQTILDGLLNAVSFSPGWSPETRWGIAVCFPLFELLVAVLLLIKRTQKIGWLLSLFMHVGLLLALGPWGLNHHAAVLVWNVFFLVQNTILFGPELKKKVVQSESFPESEKTNSSGLIKIVLAVVLLFPATQWLGVCDTWVGWSLYSAREARVTLSVHASEVNKIPKQYVHLLAEPAFEHDWQKFDLHRWAFEETNAPDYPEDRVQRAIAKAVIIRFDLQKPLLVHHGTANRLTGKRILKNLYPENRSD